MEQSPAYERFTWADNADLRHELRKATGLEEDLQQLPSEWDQILRLMDWVHHLSNHQGWAEAPDLSALNLLADVRSGKVTFRCVEFAHMLQQVCAAFGFPSRVIGLRRPESDEGFGKAHVVVDVWSNEHWKWIVLDPQLNIVYQSAAGELLSAFQIHDRVRTRRFDDIRMSREADLEEVYEVQPAKDITTFGDFEVPDGFDRDEAWDSLPEHGDFAGFMRFWKGYYYQFVFQKTYSLVRSPSTSGSDSGNQLFYHDPQDLPPVVFQRMRQPCTYTTDRNKIDFPVNGVEVQWTQAQVTEDSSIESTRSLTLHLSHSMPWFHHFEVKVNGDGLATSNNEIAIDLRAGENTVSITPINDLGRRGSNSVVRLWVN